MTADPLDRLRRPGAPPANTPPATQCPTGDTVSNHPPVAPTWAGPCLRLTGDAQPPALTLRHRDGRLLALTYSYLSGVAFDPATGITLTFVGHAVSIQGRRLKPVFDAVASQRAMDLAEAPGDVDEGGGEEPTSRYSQSRHPRSIKVRLCQHVRSTRPGCWFSEDESSVHRRPRA